MSIVELFSRAKHLQQPAAARKSKWIIDSDDESHGGLDNDVEYAFEDRNSRFGNKGKLVLSSSCGQEDSDCNEVVKSLMKGMMKTKIASKIVVKPEI